MQRLIIPSAVLALALAMAGCRFEIITPPLTATSPSPDGVSPKPSAAPSVRPTPPIPSAMRSFGPTARPSSFPSVRPTPGPNDTPWPSPGTASAMPSAPSNCCPRVILSGQIFDEEGHTVDGAIVTVRSLDASVPYTAVATTSQGSWVVNNAPEGANVEVVATRDGWTTRRRVGAFQVGSRNLINFGAPASGLAEGPDAETAAAYFISDRPEISRTEPYPDSRAVPEGLRQVKLTLSEPLGEYARDAFARAVVLFPADPLPNAPRAIDLEDADNGGIDDGLAASDLNFFGDLAAGAIGFAITDNDPNQPSEERVQGTWNAEGTEFTLALGAVLPNTAEGAKYQVGLIATGDAIEDEDGNQLGTDWQGSDKAWPADGRLLANLFKAVELRLHSLPNSDPTAARWAATHTSVTVFELQPAR